MGQVSCGCVLAPCVWRTMALGVLYGVAGLAKPSTVQQRGCASARRSLRRSSCSWEAVSEHSALQRLQHGWKMWEGKREIKLTCTKSTRELGIGKNPGFWSSGQELSSQLGCLCSVASSGHGVLYESCPCPAAFQHTD